MWHPADPKEYEHLSMRERMSRGFPYTPVDPEICQIRLKCRQLVRKYNESPDADHLSEYRKSILRELFNPESSDDVYIEPSFRCEYGYNITFGPNSFMNFDCVIMDNAPVKIGKNLLAGPNVQIMTACHPLDPEDRAQVLNEYAKPITIGDNCWIGGGVQILPGVKIGYGVTIGAGSVVTKDVPDCVVIGGNPARVIKTLDESKERYLEKLASEKMNISDS